MASRPIQEGFEVYARDGNVGFGAVRHAPKGRREFVIYVENAGEFTVPLSAVHDVHEDKVILDCSKLDATLREAIGHAHDSEDPRIADKPGS